ncbi:hypothetical protein CERZMDRAFT_88827 [Cercospora zeae-maydis SCOH1-5]|uniref:Uncharacterized protein n=1 Tax=Cercospora zeae-maydis SCOH1-5 TaxID=717836 RepID=A0A6A6EZE2_9PEZI|nr:hypothetical protein CERZMDRAFT_88827 [Cercospora zeae-maydis SCOH1-5]
MPAVALRHLRTRRYLRILTARAGFPVPQTGNSCGTSTPPQPAGLRTMLHCICHFQHGQCQPIPSREIPTAQVVSRRYQIFSTLQAIGLSRQRALGTRPTFHSGMLEFGDVQQGASTTNATSNEGIRLDPIGAVSATTVGEEQRHNRRRG